MDTVAMREFVIVGVVMVGKRADRDDGEGVMAVTMVEK